MKRKVAGISLLICLLSPIATTYLFFQFQKQQVKKEVKWQMIAGIDKDELVLLKFSKAQSLSELKWEHSKEFEYNGEMYDVVKKKIIGDSISYWCWWDHKETKLNKQLDTLLAKALDNNPQRNEKQNQLVYFFKNLFYENHTYELQIAPKLDIRQFYYSEIFTSRYYSPTAPPPRTC